MKKKKIPYTICHRTAKLLNFCSTRVMSPDCGDAMTIMWLYTFIRKRKKYSSNPKIIQSSTYSMLCGDLRCGNGKLVTFATVFFLSIRRISHFLNSFSHYLLDFATNRLLLVTIAISDFIQFIIISSNCWWLSFKLLNF